MVSLGEGCLESLFLRSVAISFAERLTGDGVESYQRHHVPYFGGSLEGGKLCLELEWKRRWFYCL